MLMQYGKGVGMLCELELVESEFCVIEPCFDTVVIRRGM